jgi:hypothetical protein
VAFLVAIQSAGFHLHSPFEDWDGLPFGFDSPFHAGLQGSSGELRLESLGCHEKSQAGVWESNLG